MKEKVFKTVVMAALAMQACGYLDAPKKVEHLYFAKSVFAENN